MLRPREEPNALGGKKRERERERDYRFSHLGSRRHLKLPVDYRCLGSSFLFLLHPPGFFVRLAELTSRTSLVCAWSKGFGMELQMDHTPPPIRPGVATEGEEVEERVGLG